VCSRDSGPHPDSGGDHRHEEVVPHRLRVIRTWSYAGAATLRGLAWSTQVPFYIHRPCGEFRTTGFGIDLFRGRILHLRPRSPLVERSPRRASKQYRSLGARPLLRIERTDLPHKREKKSAEVWDSVVTEIVTTAQSSTGCARPPKVRCH